MNISKNDRYCIQSVDNALHLLEALSEGEQEVQISQLSERVGLSKSTIFRLLVTFQRRGYVEQPRGSHSYRLGLSAFELGQKCLSRMTLLTRARPEMERLARQSRESIYLAVRRKNEILLLDLADTPQQVKVASLVGRRIPLAGTAAGQAFAAFDKRERPAGLTDAAVKLVRQQGYALAANDIEQGVVSLAAPLLDYQQRMPGTLLMVVPDFRLETGRNLQQLSDQLLAAAEAISSQLGYLSRQLYAQGA